MKIANFSVDQPVAILMFILVGVFLGWISLAGIPIDLFPELDLPFVTVSTTYTDVAPQEIESLVTQRIEEAVASVQNVKNIHSISQEGMSLVMVEFEWGTDLFEAKMDVRETVDRARPVLPSEAEDPVVGSFSIMGEQGAVRLSLTSEKRDLDYVYRLADKTLKPRLEAVHGERSGVDPLTIDFTQSFVASTATPVKSSLTKRGAQTANVSRDAPSKSRGAPPPGHSDLKSISGSPCEKPRNRLGRLRGQGSDDQARAVGGVFCA